MAPSVHLALLFLFDMVKAVLLMQEELAALGALRYMMAVRVSRVVHKLLIILEFLVAVVAIVFLVVEETHEWL